ncbi:waprin-Phi1-like isoform X1 [Sinocyclocheilus rhinocerous]|uniref:waprin-Phi1-like isoform X1 n=1 Tax=Sinocyclocheilus rhinocerous TaxID=307959 RepID=UPI0007B9889C|nr:PREDICTED: waprin-Phi1-like isoform X1 [Sinocyclocheilus rhinocerous]
MTARVCFSLIAVLFCVSVCLSTRDTEGAATAEPAKPGVCPRKNLEVAVSGVCVGSCSYDHDCPNNQKCCRSGCGRQCMPPYNAGPAKPGVCPRKDLEAMLGVCAEMCSHDSDCPNDEKCCSNGCGHQCMPPYKGPEKPGLSKKS